MSSAHNEKKISFIATLVGILASIAGIITLFLVFFPLTETYSASGAILSADSIRIPGAHFTYSLDRKSYKVDSADASGNYKIQMQSHDVVYIHFLCRYGKDSIDTSVKLVNPDNITQNIFLVSSSKSYPTPPPITARPKKPNQVLVHNVTTANSSFNGIGVLATENGSYNSNLTNNLFNWTSKNDLPKTKLQTSFINNGVFNSFFEDLPHAINAVRPYINGYICVLRTNTFYDKSVFEELLVKAVTKWEVVIFNTNTAEIIFNNGNTTMASAASEESAKQRNYETIFTFLNNQVINLK